MPFIIELKNSDGALYDVPEHTWNFRGDTPEQRGTATVSQVYVSNIDAWKYDALTGEWGKGEQIKYAPANAAEALTDDLYDEDEQEVIMMLQQWASLHPEGHWDCG